MQRFFLYIASLLLSTSALAASYSGIYMTASGVFDANAKTVTISVSQVNVLDGSSRLLSGTLNINQIEVWRSTNHEAAEKIGTIAGFTISNSTPTTAVTYVDSALPDPGTGSALVLYTLKARIGSYLSDESMVNNADGQGTAFNIDYRAYPNPVSGLQAIVYAPDSVVIRFTAPTHCTNGDELTSITNIRIDKYSFSSYSWKSNLHSFNSRVATPGAELSYTDTGIASETDLWYRVCVLTGSGENTCMSEYVEIHAYNGEDTPNQISDLSAHYENDAITLSWQAPTTGLRGGNLNPANLRYRIQRSVEGKNYTTLIEDARQTTYTDHDLLAHAASYIYLVTPYNTQGSGNLSVASIYAGAGYDLPFTETFTGGMDNSGWLISGTNTDTWYTSTYIYNAENGSSVSANGGMICNLIYASNTVAGRRDILRSAPLYCSDISTLHVAFDYFVMGSGYDNKLLLEYSTDGEDFTEVACINYKDETEKGWQSTTVDILPCGATTCYIRFVCVKGSHSNSLGLDNILITGEHTTALPIIETEGHARLYNLLGQEVDETYKGIVINVGKTPSKKLYQY